MKPGLMARRAANREPIGDNRSSAQRASELESLRACSWLKSDPAWATELALMGRHGFKIEGEALCSIGNSFLAREYLPAQIGSREYLELLL